LPLRLRAVAAATAWTEAAGAATTPRFAARIAALRAGALEALGPDAANEHWRAGAASTVDETVAVLRDVAGWQRETPE
jgi:hypothetical protein